MEIIERIDDGEGGEVCMCHTSIAACRSRALPAPSERDFLLSLLVSRNDLELAAFVDSRKKSRPGTIINNN